MSLFFRSVVFRQGNTASTFAKMSWTTIPPTDATERDIYVAASGVDSALFDATHGSIAHPYLTLSAGKAQIRTGHGDRMWINKGDTFTNQTLGEWEGISGSSTTHPIIVGTYGTGARPIIQTNNASLATLANHNNPANHIWFIGLEGTAQNYSPSGFTYGISWLDSATDLLIEDCFLHNYSVAGRCQGTTDAGAPGRHSNIRLRGNVLADTYMNLGIGDSHGWFFENVDGVTFEWNILDKCGYNGDPSLYTVFRHATYIQSNCTSATYIYNTICRGDGAQLRPGGIFTNNLVFSGVTSFQIGGHSGSALEPNSTTTFENNVAISGMGWGCRVRSMTSGTLKNNLFIKGNPLDPVGATNDPYGFVMDYSDSSLSAVANVNIVGNNFYDWGGPAFRFSVSSNYYSGITLSGNAVQNPHNALNANALISMAVSSITSSQLSHIGYNHLAARDNSQAIDVAGSFSSLAQWGPVIGDIGSDTSAVIYVDPTADLASYNAYIGGPGTNLDMINKFRGQSKDNWNDNYTAAAANYYFQQKYSYSNVETGWTTLTSSIDSRLIFVAAVSSGGSDSNDGLTINTPKATIAAGKALLRNGYPDWLQLKCGDSWNETLGYMGDIAGRSISERMVITSYGSGARPLCKTGTDSFAQSFATTGGGSFMAFTDLAITADGYTGTSTTPNIFEWLGGSDGFLLEGCELYNAFHAGVLQAGAGFSHARMQVRRNVMREIYSHNPAAFAAALYIEHAVNILIEENVFRHMGWLDPTYWTFFHHTLYINNNCTNPTVRNNIAENGDGYQCRPGGTFTGNIASRVRVGVVFGLGTYPNAGGVSGNCNDNIVLESSSPGHIGDTAQDYLTEGFSIGNLHDASFQRNIVANRISVSPAFSVGVVIQNGNGNSDGEWAGGGTLSMQNCTLADLIVHDHGCTGFETNCSGLSGNTLTRSVFQSPNNSDYFGYYTDTSGSTPAGYNPEQVFTLASSGFSSSEIAITSSHFSRNTVSTHGTTNVSYNGTPKTFSQFFTDAGATNCSTSVVSYPHSDKARIGDLWVYQGNSDLGSNELNYSAWWNQAILQRKGSWRTNYTAQTISSYIVGYCFGSPW